MGGSAGPSWLPETIALMNARGIPDDGTIYFAGTAQERSGNQWWLAIDAFFASMKNDSILSELDALWIWDGGTAERNKFNVLNPLDSNSAFRLQFNGGITHASTGLTGNGVNGYCTTFYNVLNSSVKYTRNSASVFVYTRTNQAGPFADMSASGGNNGILVFTGRTGGTDRAVVNNDCEGNACPTTAPILGMVYIERENSTTVKRYFNGILNNTLTHASLELPNRVLELLTYNFFFGSRLFYSPRTHTVMGIGAGLGATKQAQLRTHVQTLMTSLGLNV
jgi:hypothetical protein